ncbi:MAG TPA: hypothetical protein VMV09_05300 [Candidatus Saccharimonadales bacterium]|nr:hypothetical protein [Candidatus Saccharimonadales bacterium]
MLSAIGDAFDRVTPIRALLAGLVAALIIVHGVVPDFRVDGYTIGLIGLLLVLVLTPLLESASFMGGGVRFRTTEAVTRLSDTVGLLQAQVQSQLRTQSLEPQKSPEHIIDLSRVSEAGLGSSAPLRPTLTPVTAHTTYADVLAQAHDSPKLALLKLTGDLERATSRLLLSRDRRPASSLMANTKELVRAQVLPPAAEDAMRQFVQVRNRIAHGDLSADDELVLATLDIGVSILNTIELIESGPMPGPRQPAEG